MNKLLYYSSKWLLISKSPHRVWWSINPYPTKHRTDTGLIWNGEEFQGFKGKYYKTPSHIRESFLIILGGEESFENKIKPSITG